eukprot:CAMPEP_0185025510 /NCGR_PEP_ID=MMETSP1103-20130426/8436_1 /TAXON_ID=36769 /ORGANISM="Paraphysomonas bandaiensis, Strain Caron Lab Isolate" /LENGTH=269 /DNA_ID=CAMNT_0027558719 /DNA_START=292 /DNA_END=1101 /DNA_ORIENTATION=+
MGFHVVSGCLTDEGILKLQSIVSKTVKCNVCIADDIEKLAMETEKLANEKDCKVWAVVNNAGIADGGALDWTDMDVWRRVMEVNFFGVVAVTKAMLPLLKKNPGSRIINLSSLAGLLSGAAIGPYFASKHAVEGMAKCLREEMKPWNIHVSNINPGFMRTPILSAGLAAAKKSFESAPAEITSQYDPSFIDHHVSMMNQSAEDPMKVVDVIVEAITDKNPPMWYFPGNSANIMRVMPTCSSGVSDAINSLAASKLTPQPTPEALRNFRS